MWWSYCSANVPRSGRPTASMRTVTPSRCGREHILDHGGKSLARRSHAQSHGRREQHSQHAEQVGHRVADGRKIGVPGLVGGGEGGGVRQGSGIDAREDGTLEAHGIGRQDRDQRADEQATDDDSERASTRLHRGEEGRAGPDSDDVGEHRQAEDAQDLRKPEAVVVCREGQGREQDGGRAKREALDLDGAQGPSDGHDDREEQQGLFRCNVRITPENLADVHIPSFFSLP